MRWLKHAFAVEPEGPAKPTEEQQAIVDRVCRAIVKRHLATPALMLLEMSRPLNYLGSQMMHFFAPMVSIVTDARGYRQFAAFLEQRGAIDHIARRIEQLEAEATKIDKARGGSPTGDNVSRP